MERERTKRAFLQDYVLSRAGAINTPLELGSINAIVVDGKVAWALIEEAVQKTYPVPQ